MGLKSFVGELGHRANREATELGKQQSFFECLYFTIYEAKWVRKISYTFS